MIVFEQSAFKVSNFKLTFVLCFRSGRCKRRCLYENGTLALYNVKEPAEGDYECRAKQGEHTSSVYSASVRIACEYNCIVFAKINTN